jgi:DNA mismatch endonuclease (patch repair protein)
MADNISRRKRSDLMSKVRSTGNRSTERKVEVILKEAGIKGWNKHPKRVLGHPDFFFPKSRVVVFVDGCFWHACPHCRRPLPTGNAEYWTRKIESNRLRDNRVRRKLRGQGFHVFRIWEHELKRGTWFHRIVRAIGQRTLNAEKSARKFYKN